jgi:hypothetical protein
VLCITGRHRRNRAGSSIEGRALRLGGSSGARARRRSLAALYGRQSRPRFVDSRATRSVSTFAAIAPPYEILRVGERAKTCTIGRDFAQDFHVFMRRAFEVPVVLASARASGAAAKSCGLHEEEVRFEDRTSAGISTAAPGHVLRRRDRGAPRGAVRPYVDVTRLKKAESAPTASREA